MSQIYDFSYTGNVQSVLLLPGIYKLECWGASGGTYYQNNGGKGGYTSGVISLADPTELFIYVGEQGKFYESATNLHATFNGGGTVTNGTDASSGGGATDIRLVGGSWDNNDSLYSRLIVAGGGGGNEGHDRSSYGGNAGGESGSSGYTASNSWYSGKGATQSEGGAAGYASISKKAVAGSFGKGGNGVNNVSYAGAGGGGWYGGGGGFCGAGGGGSSYAITNSSYKPNGYNISDIYYLTETNLTPGGSTMTYPDGSSGTGNIGNGYARITLIESYPYSISLNKNILTMEKPSNSTISNIKILVNDNQIESIDSPADNISYTIALNNFTFGVNYIKVVTTSNVNNQTVVREYNFKYVKYGSYMPLDADLEIVSKYLEAMNTQISDLRNNLANILTNQGFDVASIPKISDLINLVESMTNTNDQETTELLNQIATLEASVGALNTEIDNAKQTLISSLTNKNISANEDESINELSTKVNSIPLAQGDAVEANVLSGKTFTNSDGTLRTGTMANKGGAQTVTPGTSNKTLNSGYYSGNITVKGDSNLVAANIVSGKSIFGVNGSATVASLGGKKFATGTFTLTCTGRSGSTQDVTYSLSFTPSLIILIFPNIKLDTNKSGNSEIINAYNVAITSASSYSYVGWDATYCARYQITNITSSGFTLSGAGARNNVNTNVKVTWYALG